MFRCPDSIEKIKKSPSANTELLKDLLRKINKIIDGKRAVMYSDVINLIIREGFIEENYKNILLWCNYKIRAGETFVEFNGML